MLESLLISTAMGQIIVRIMYALHVTGFGSAFFIILAAGCAITCMLEVFVSWLNDKILHAMSRKHLAHKYEEDTGIRITFEPCSAEL